MATVYLPLGSIEEWRASSAKLAEARASAALWLATGGRRPTACCCLLAAGDWPGLWRVAGGGWRLADGGWLWLALNDGLWLWLWRLATDGTQLATNSLPWQLASVSCTLTQSLASLGAPAAFHSISIFHSLSISGMKDTLSTLILELL